MILDASVLIALLDDRDAHHAGAEALVLDGAPGRLLLHEVTLAEALMQPARLDRDAAALAALADLGIETAPTSPDFPRRLARVRAEATLRMPDCIVLATAELHGLPLATFDDRLAGVARGRGVNVTPDA